MNPLVARRLWGAPVIRFNEIPGGIMHEIEVRVRNALVMALKGTIDVSALSRADNLFQAGMTSHQTVQVMLGLEDEFDLEFPDEDLVRSTFSTIGSMVDAVAVHS